MNKDDIVVWQYDHRTGKTTPLTIEDIAKPILTQEATNVANAMFKLAYQMNKDNKDGEV